MKLKSNPDTGEKIIHAFEIFILNDSISSSIQGSVGRDESEAWLNPRIQRKCSYVVISENFHLVFAQIFSSGEIKAVSFLNYFGDGCHQCSQIKCDSKHVNEKK